MAVTWKIARNAGAPTPLDLAESQPLIQRFSLDTDQLTFRLPKANPEDDLDFAYDDLVSLLRDDVRYFLGRVARCRTVFRSGQAFHEYLVEGPWADLERIVYQQSRKIRSEDFLTLGDEDTTRVTLGQNEFGHQISTGSQILSILSYALSQGARLALGSVPELIMAPLEEARDLTCAEAIRRQIANTPDAVAYFDYSLAAPQLNIARRADLAAVMLDLDDANLVEEFSPAERKDLVPRGIVFVYTSTEENPDDGKTYTRITRDSAGETTGLNVIVATIDLMGAGTTNQETAPSGFAGEYYASLQVANWSGPVVIREQDCSGMVLPGHKLNLANGRAAWATMDAVVQSISEDLFTGVTTIETGPPDHLSPQDFVNQLLFNRKKAASTNFRAVQNGDDNPDAGVDPASYTAGANAKAVTGKMNTQPIKTCDEDTGDEVTVNVYAPCDNMAKDCT